MTFFSFLITKKYNDKSQRFKKIKIDNLTLDPSSDTKWCEPHKRKWDPVIDAKKLARESSKTRLLDRNPNPVDTHESNLKLNNQPNMIPMKPIEDKSVQVGLIVQEVIDAQKLKFDQLFIWFNYSISFLVN